MRQGILCRFPLLLCYQPGTHIVTEEVSLEEVLEMAAETAPPEVTGELEGTDDQCQILKIHNFFRTMNRE